MDGGHAFWTVSCPKSIPMLRWARTYSEVYHSHHPWPTVLCHIEHAGDQSWEVSIFLMLRNWKENYKISTFSFDGTATTSFPETPLFPSYLVAFSVSNLPFKSNANTSNGLPHRVFAQPSLIESAELALTDGERFMNLFTDYLQVNYSLPKMDQLAAPGYYGGIENWGKKIW